MMKIFVLIVLLSCVTACEQNRRQNVAEAIRCAKKSFVEIGATVSRVSCNTLGDAEYSCVVRLENGDVATVHVNQFIGCE